MTRADVGLGAAFHRYRENASPWIIAAFLVLGSAARVAVGDWRVSDLVLVAVMLVAFPFFEWVVHTMILHWRPIRLAGRMIDPLLARKHREHHAQPRDLPLVFIPWQTLVWLLPITVLIGLWAFPRWGLGLTYLVVVGVLGSVYEWTHFLIHSDYRPKSAVYRAIWRNHRLHHFRNERYWFTVTTAGTADRLLGTYPDPGQVAPSPTARALHQALRPGSGAADRSR